MRPERGDVVRSTDPFKFGAEQQRPWLIVNDDSHPFADEQFIAVAVSTDKTRRVPRGLTPRQFTLLGAFPVHVGARRASGDLVNVWTDSTTAWERVETIATTPSEPRTANWIAD